VSELRHDPLDVERATPSLAADLLALCKPRIVLFVGLAAAVGAALGARATGLHGVERVLEAAFWTACAAGAANAFNQIIERDLDARMLRTRERPLPAGRVSLGQALTFATVLGAAAVLALALRFGLLAAFLVLATLASYALVYTPLKRVTTMNTLVGALPGAAPPLVGYVALAGEPGPWAWMLFAVVFAWQFPHFLAIAYLYREDYARAGMAMLPARPGRERMAARQALHHALALVPVSIVPAVRGDAGPVLCLGALALGLGYAAAAARFAWRTDERSARTLLHVSLIHLPLYLGLVLLDPIVRMGLVASLS
jgi:protoheme IX farnesyltransferase